MIKKALQESKKLLEYFIECDEDFSEEEIESIRHFLKALKAGCGCDDYNGFDCGCGRRSFLSNEALKEVGEREYKVESLPISDASNRLSKMEKPKIKFTYLGLKDKKAQNRLTIPLGCEIAPDGEGYFIFPSSRKIAAGLVEYEFSKKDVQSVRKAIIASVLRVTDPVKIAQLAAKMEEIGYSLIWKDDEF